MDDEDAWTLIACLSFSLSHYSLFISLIIVCEKRYISWMKKFFPVMDNFTHNEGNWEEIAWMKESLTIQHVNFFFLQVISLILGVNLLSREGNSQTGHRMFQLAVWLLVLFTSSISSVSTFKPPRIETESVLSDNNRIEFWLVSH